ncbi:MAG: HD domain-containing protein [Flavobacteriales bacterium]|nr:HD domain-containing protein [Flavobacteriales bacterium]MBK7248734.1 HD domain-containing protein [Flavobacteriales bacterium]MBK9059039.1 HD domain-containing protein [Flavobacteriales bacterium]MBK9599342.1 HD domain-containing protein [Flavobacteriales bacterium]QQS74219.1 MAG: HD domain-containing protein [Flavobacteriales bacterium]
MVSTKILNDPIHGFITVPHPLLLRLIDHPWFQRLRYIKQLGLSHLVYPGALHTRFHHALGAMHLMGLAIESLRGKGHVITEEEALGAHVAILLHDIGHGPFSHALEHSLVEGISHEDVGALVMERLNAEFKGALDLGIAIFHDRYPKHVLHQLVSGQLDVDRMDYLNRDSFYTGVSEGVIGADRIIKMLQVVDDRLVVEEKAIYSIEKFIVARRLMYWQVYLHKTVVACEQMLVQTLRRAKFLGLQGVPLFGSPALLGFLTHRRDRASFEEPSVLADFMRLDDHDIMGALKVWADHPDPVLSRLASDLLGRHTLRIRLRTKPWDPAQVTMIRQEVARQLNITEKEAGLFVLTDRLENNAYDNSDGGIKLLFKDGRLEDIAEASDNLGISAMSGTVEKHYLAFPRWLGKEWFEANS